MSHVLSNQLINKASLTELVIGITVICRTHSHELFFRDTFLIRYNDLMYIIFPIEKVLICPFAAT